MKIKSSPITIFAFKDRNAFLICLGISILFWIATKFGKQYDQEFTYKISYNVPEGLAFAEIPPEELKPVFSGSGWEVFYQGLNRKKHVLPIILDMENTQRFSRGALIDRLNMQTETNLEIKSLNIDFLDIRLEERRTRKIPVELKGEVPIADQFVLREAITIEPDSVMVSGPSSIVDSIRSWDLPLPEREPVSQSFSDEATLKAPRNALITVEPEKITLSTIVEALTDKSVYVPIQRDTAFPYRLFPDHVRVTFSVGLSKFDQVTREDFEVDLAQEGSDLQPGAIPVKLTRSHPIAQNVQFSPKSVEVLAVQDTVSVE